MAEQVRTAVLDIAYEAWGPVDGPPVVLVHGFPDDARSWDQVAAELARHGRRVIAPYLRGVGPTPVPGRQHSALRAARRASRRPRHAA